MGSRVKLPVFEVLSEAFSFGWKKLIPLTLLYTVASIVILVPTGYLAYALFPELFNDPVAFLEQLEAADFDTMGVQFTQLNLLSNLIQLASALVSSIFIVAIIRAIVADESLFPPKLNANIFRYIVGTIIMVLFMIPLILVFVLIVVGVAAGFEAMEDSGSNAAIALVPAILIGILVFFGVISRLALIPIDIVANSKLQVASGWRAGKGNSMRLVGMYALGFILIAIIFIVALIPIGLTMMVAFSDVIALVSENGDIEPADLFEGLKTAITSPIGLIGFFLLFLMEVYASGVMAALPTFAYSRVTGSAGPAD